jgi:transcriptional regulator with XRE-family HTH domain
MPKKRDLYLLWFGNRVRAIRQHKCFSIEELAELADFDRTYLGGVERGERNIGLLNIKKIADALEITVQNLFDPDFHP